MYKWNHMDLVYLVPFVHSRSYIITRGPFGSQLSYSWGPPGTPSRTPGGSQTPLWEAILLSMCGISWTGGLIVAQMWTPIARRCTLSAPLVTEMDAYPTWGTLMSFQCIDCKHQFGNLSMEMCWGNLWVDMERGKWLSLVLSPQMTHQYQSQNCYLFH